MTYEQFVYKLRQFQAVKVHLDDYEIDILLNKGYICVGSLSAISLQVFHNLSDALEQWHHSEDRRSLGEIINMVDDKEVYSNPVFREITILDPKFLVEPTNLQWNSMTGGVTFSDSSLEHNVQCMIESISACLYNVTLETRIYQILEWRWLKEMLDRKRILFKSPLTYHDVWESFMFRKYVWEEGTDESQLQLTECGKNFYCSCWSVCEESDGIWNNRIRGRSVNKPYSKPHKSVDCQAVKIETTVGDLMFHLGLDKIYPLPNIWKNFRIGRVGYFDEFKLRTFKEQSLSLIESRKNVSLGYYLPYLIMQSLFIKRKQFEYEQEVRLLLINNIESKSLQRRKCGVFFQTDPCRWIHEVVVHPDCLEKDYKDIRNQLYQYGIDRVVESPLSRKFCVNNHTHR